jgi:hypothetical protein
MFEIGIFSVIVLAVSYWAVLWLMGRREDVLHGEFVEGKAKSGTKSGEPVRATSSEPSVRPVFPDRSAIADRPVFPERTSLAAQPVLAERIALSEKPAQATAPEQPAFRPERLEQLLASIKQDLNQLVQK